MHLISIMYLKWVTLEHIVYDKSRQFKMERAVFYGFDEKASLVVEKVPLPTIKDGEILGKMLAATICGSDIHTLEGKRKVPVPSVLGHEGVIEVVSHKRPDSGLQAGDRLTFCMIEGCNDCERCRDGLPNKCVTLFKYSQGTLTNGTGANGCYATHIVIRKNTHVAKIPAEISNHNAAPVNCALATMVCALDGVIKKMALEKEPKRTKTALIQGAGLLGLYGCALLHEAGYKVYCSDVSQKRLELVSQFGSTPVLAGDSSGNGPEVNSVDVVVEVCGNKSVVSEGLRLVRYGGTYLWVGLVHPDSKLDMMTAEQVIDKCLTIQGFHNYAPVYLDKSVEFLARTLHKYPYDKIFSPPFALRDIDDAVAMTLKQNYHRVCIEP